MILFLDDNPNRAAIAYQRWSEEKRPYTIWCRTAEEAISVLRDYALTEAHLGHDLEGETYVDTRREDCGMEVVRWLEAQETLDKFNDCVFICHSWNLSAGNRMAERLCSLGLKAEHIPFGMTR